jgi:glycosyltransferase involved in cell wall biosynthesis
VSIVTPSFNQGKYIRNCIDSIRNQTYRPIEHIIIDNCSTDETGKILKEYKRNSNDIEVKIIVEPDKGQSDAINKGFKMANGEIVGWLNSDDLYLHDTFRTVAETFMKKHEVDAISGDYIIIDENSNIILKRKEIGFDFEILLYCFDYIAQPTVFFRRHIFGKVGYLDESLHYGMDWEFWLRLGAHGTKFLHIPVFLAALRWQPSAKTIIYPPRLSFENELIQQKYWNNTKFKSKYVHKLYALFLKQWYRGKRQTLKLIRRGCLDFPPGNFYLRITKWRQRKGV